MASTDFKARAIKEAKQAEFLVHRSFPWKLVEEVGVISSSVRAKTEEAITVSAPDLFVQLVAGDARYRTPVALDTYAEAFDFRWSFHSRGFHPPGSRSRWSRAHRARR